MEGAPVIDSEYAIKSLKISQSSQRLIWVAMHPAGPKFASTAWVPLSTNKVGIDVTSLYSNKSKWEIVYAPSSNSVVLLTTKIAPSKSFLWLSAQQGPVSDA